MPKLADAFVEIRADGRKLITGLRRLKARITSAAVGMGRAFSRAFSRFGMIGGVGITGGMVLALSRFQKQMAAVNTMLDRDTEPLLKGMTKDIRRMSVEFGESTESLAKGLYDILSASVPAAKAIDVLTVSSKAAAAGFTTTAVAADAITSVVNAFSISADRATDVADVMFATVKAGKLTFDELAAGIGQVAPTAALVGVNFQELSAALATITKQGITFNEAATAMNMFLVSLLDPQQEAIKLSKKLGLNITLERIAREGLLPILKDLVALGPNELKYIGGRIQGFKALAVVMSQLTDLEDTRNDMMNAGGKMQEAFAKATDTLAFRLARLKQVGIQGLVTGGGAMLKAWEAITNETAAIWSVIGVNFKTMMTDLMRILGLGQTGFEDFRTFLSDIWLKIAKEIVALPVTFAQVWFTIERETKDFLGRMATLLMQGALRLGAAVSGVAEVITFAISRTFWKGTDKAGPTGFIEQAQAVFQAEMAKGRVLAENEANALMKDLGTREKQFQEIMVGLEQQRGDLIRQFMAAREKAGVAPKQELDTLLGKLKEIRARMREVEEGPIGPGDRQGLGAILTRQRGAAFTGGMAGLVGAVTAPRLDPLRESVTIQRDMLGHLRRIEKGVFAFSAVGNN